MTIILRFNTIIVCSILNLNYEKAAAFKQQILRDKTCFLHITSTFTKILKTKPPQIYCWKSTGVNLREYNSNNNRLWLCTDYLSQLRRWWINSSINLAISEVINSRCGFKEKHSNWRDNTGIITKALNPCFKNAISLD